MRTSQKHADVIDLEGRAFETVPVAAVLREAGQVPGRSQVFSSLQHGSLRPVVGTSLLEKPEDLVVTFDGFTHSTPYPAFLRWCLQTLERHCGCPVDIEFAFDGERFYLLQCRPMAIFQDRGPVRLPGYVPEEKVIFSATRDVMSGCVHGIDHIVLVDPEAYYDIPTSDRVWPWRVRSGA